MSEKWQDDLQAALRNLEFSPSGDGMTTVEISTALGWTESIADSRLRKLFRSGAIETCRKFAMNRAGFMQSVPAYRLKQKG